MRHPIPALVLALVAGSLAAADAPAAPAAPAAAPVRALTAEEQARGFAANGFQIGRNSPLPGYRANLDLNEVEVDAFLSGLRLAMLGKPSPAALTAEQQAGFEELLKARVLSKSTRNKEANVAFLAKVDATKGVSKTESGLRYRIDKPGSGAKPTKASQVSCRYTGQLHDGTVFDSTKNRNDTPAEFGLGEVIPGWTEGLQLIAKGGVIHLWIPANLGYGDQEMDAIPAGSVLEFEVELVDVK